MAEMPGVVRVATAICAAIAALGLSAAGSQTPADAAVPRAVASNGAVIDMPDIAGLDCPGMERALRRIDLSRYRGPEPVPQGHPDWPIFDYEDRLSAAYYKSCTLERHRLDDPGPAFSSGFEKQ
jgi:hypothetical protein